MEIQDKYKALNSSFKRVLIYHAGIDAGFFTEYTYMMNAMIWCLQNKIQFKLYSSDANFKYKSGWEDYFEPFCEQVEDNFHHKFNLHRIPSFTKLFKLAIKEKKYNLIIWKIKVIVLGKIGRIIALSKYHQSTLLNHNVKFNPDQKFNIPELDIDGDYVDAFNKMVDITWHFNKDIKTNYNELSKNISLDNGYIGCQVRGGDKITEVDLMSPEYMADTIKKTYSAKSVFVLTDDYNIFKKLKSYASDINWQTLCSEEEKGYVNKSFTNRDPEKKKKQMARFLTSISILLKAKAFIGSVTPAPSLFLIKRMYPNMQMIDCKREDFNKIIMLPIARRGEIAKKYSTFAK